MVVGEPQKDIFPFSVPVAGPGYVLTGIIALQIRHTRIQTFKRSAAMSQ